MKLFDLTFNGGVLPDYDPGQVRADFARLFCIDNGTLLEKIFSGQTVILGHNLDRKTAANYFRKITLLGGQPRIVNTPKHRAVRGDEILVLNTQLQGQAEPQSAAKLEPDTDSSLSKKTLKTPAKTAKIMATRAQEDGQTSNRLQAVQQAKRHAANAEARLTRQKDQHDRIAQEEIDKINHRWKNLLAMFQHEISVVMTAAQTQSQALSARLEHLAEEQAACKDQALRDVSHLEDLIEQKTNEDAELIDMLEQRLVSTRESSLETVRQLEQQLEDAQLCAQEKIADMEKQLQEARSRSQADLSVLQERKKEALCSRDGEIEELKQQAEAARRQSANACAALHQQQQTLRARQDEEEKKLQTMKQDIEVRRSQGVANVTKELKHVMEQTREILKATEATPPDTGVKQHRDWPADNSAAADSSTAEVIR